MSEISKTGYWNGETAHHHHVHSEQLSEWICNFIEDKEIFDIADFGCGLGNYCKDIATRFPEPKNYVVGVEADTPKQAVYDKIINYDLTNDVTDDPRLNSELIISLEVGEHIPAQHMDTYLDNITYHANYYIITSWAVRGQEGFGHVNCLDNHEIIPEFEKRGFELMEKETEDARSVIEDKAHWFKKTILIFKIK